MAGRYAAAPALAGVLRAHACDLKGRWNQGVGVLRWSKARANWKQQ